MYYGAIVLALFWVLLLWARKVDVLTSRSTALYALTWIGVLVTFLALKWPTTMITGPTVVLIVVLAVHVGLRTQGTSNG